MFPDLKELGIHRVVPQPAHASDSSVQFFFKKEQHTVSITWIDYIGNLWGMNSREPYY